MPTTTDLAAEGLDRLRTEFQALTGGCGVYELGDRVKIALTGKDRVRWLNGMVSNNIRDLSFGHGVYAFLLNPQGHILGDLYAYNRGESILLDLDRAQEQKLLATLRRYIIMDKVELADVSGHLKAVGISGPGSQALLQAVGVEFRELAPLQSADLRWRDVPVTVVRNDNPAVPCFELWLAPEQTAALRQNLMNEGAEAVGSTGLEVFRIACGVPRYGQDIRERDLPQETGQVRALSFTKGCYIGQEIVERIRARGSVHRAFGGFFVAGALPVVGTKISAEGKDVGEVTSGTSLPFPSGDRAVVLGYLRNEAAAPGKILTAGDAQLTIANIPFTEIFKN